MSTKRAKSAATVTRPGPTLLSMRANGGTTRLMVEVNCGVQMETLMKASGKTIKPTVSVILDRRMVRRDT